MTGQADAALSVQLSQLAADRGVAAPDGTPSPELLLHSVAIFGDLARVAGDLQSQAVAAAQESGLSWAQIGSALGTSRQAAQQRFDSAGLDLLAVLVAVDRGRVGSRFDSLPGLFLYSSASSLIRQAQFR